MRLLVLLSAAALAVTAGAHATPARGTLTGLVTRGPIAPVCVAEQPCDEPAPNVRLLFSRNGAVIGRATSNADGRYSVRLPAGSYSVRRGTVAGPVDVKLEPNHVRVYAGRLTHIGFSIDTGIR